MSNSGSASKDAGEWGNNKEMNPAPNSSATDDTTTELETGDPGRTPGKAEGVDEAEETGNED